MNHFTPWPPELNSWVPEFADLIAIRSVSADPDSHESLEEACSWLAERVAKAGGTVEVDRTSGRPLLVGHLDASTEPALAPTVLCYAHLDVQPAANPSSWRADPFDLTRDGQWFYGRGVADDKGPLFMLVKAFEHLRATQALPVNLLILSDTEEEVGGDAASRWVRAHSDELDAALVLDLGMVTPDWPAMTTATRGMCFVRITVTTGSVDLHSGLYGGAAMNALHALHDTLSAILPVNGQVREELRVGLEPPDPTEVSGWQNLEAGDSLLAQAGARPADPAAEKEFYVRTWAEPSLELHGVGGGESEELKTIVPSRAHAQVSMRLGVGQVPEQVMSVLEQLVKESAPTGADVDFEVVAAAPPSSFPSHDQFGAVVAHGMGAIFGREPARVRCGGSIPIVSALAEAGVPSGLTGFCLPDSNPHGQDERLFAEHLTDGAKAIAEILRQASEIPRRRP